MASYLVREGQICDACNQHEGPKETRHWDTCPNPECSGHWCEGDDECCQGCEICVCGQLCTCDVCGCCDKCCECEHEGD